MIGTYEKITLPDNSSMEVRVENDKLIIPIIVPSTSKYREYEVAEVAIRGDLIRQLVNNKK